MKRKSVVVSIVIVMLYCASASAQSKDLEWKAKEVRTLEEVVGWLIPVCGAPGVGKVKAGKGVLAACKVCPRGSETNEGPLVAKRVVEFTASNGMKAAVISTSGCSQGFNFDDGTVVLHPTGAYVISAGRPEYKVEMRPEVHSEDCQWRGGAVPTASCIATTIGQGAAVHSLSVMTLFEGRLHANHVANFEDVEAACHFEGRFSEKVEDIAIVDADGDGSAELAVSLTTKTGRYKTKPDPMADNCDDVKSGKVKVTTKREVQFFRRGMNGQMSRVKIAAIKDAKLKKWLAGR